MQLQKPNSMFHADVWRTAVRIVVPTAALLLYCLPVFAQGTTPKPPQADIPESKQGAVPTQPSPQNLVEQPKGIDPPSSTNPKPINGASTIPSKSDTYVPYYMLLMAVAGAGTGAGITFAVSRKPAARTLKQQDSQNMNLRPNAQPTPQPAAMSDVPSDRSMETVAGTGHTPYNSPPPDSSQEARRIAQQVDEFSQATAAADEALRTWEKEKQHNNFSHAQSIKLNNSSTLDLAERIKDLHDTTATESASINKRLEDIQNKLISSQNQLEAAIRESKAVIQQITAWEEELPALTAKINDVSVDASKQLLDVIERLETIHLRVNAEIQDREIIIAEQDAKLSTHAGEVTKLQDANIALEKQAKIYEDEPGLRDYLEQKRGNVPTSLREFVDGLLLLVKRIEDKDRDGLAAEPDQLDQYVYRTPLAYGRLSAECQQGREGVPKPRIEPDDVLRVIALQAWAHRQLQTLDINVIHPANGAPFNPQLHRCGEADLVWVNDDLARHNTIAGVKRLGYVVDGKLLRPADVKRYVFAGAQLPAEAEPMSLNSSAPARLDIRSAAQQTDVADPNFSEPKVMEPKVSELTSADSLADINSKMHADKSDTDNIKDSQIPTTAQNGSDSEPDTAAIEALLLQQSVTSGTSGRSQTKGQ